jgi:radical SAM superfamily enzyme YgiQ (UPF0313 family)
MLGYPGETKEDIKETIEHLIESNPDEYTLTVAYPIKGTKLYQEVEDKIISPYQFELNTDRDIDFTRTHPKKYYEHARKWLHYEVYSGTHELPVLRKGWLKIRSWKSQLDMWLTR